MKRSLLERLMVNMSISLILLTVLFTAPNLLAIDFGFLNHTILTADAGYIDYDKTGLGDGNSYRGTLSKKFLIGKENPAEIELGAGLQYYHTDNPNVLTVLDIYVVRDNQLSDYFPFALAQLNIPVIKYIKIPLGTRLGAHLINQTYKLYEIGFSNYRQESIKSTLFGSDFFIGLSVGHEKLPVGGQIQIGMSFLPGEFRGFAPFGVGTTAGFHLKF